MVLVGMLNLFTTSYWGTYTVLTCSFCKQSYISTWALTFKAGFFYRIILIVLLCISCGLTQFLWNVGSQIVFSIPNGNLPKACLIIFPGEWKTSVQLLVWKGKCEQACLLECFPVFQIMPSYLFYPLQVRKWQERLKASENPASWVGN